MGDVNRRQALGLIGAAAAGSLAFTWSPGEVARAARWVRSRAGAQARSPQFFTTHEWRTVRLLADIIIPRDERSGSATDAGVPEFIDFIMTDGNDEQRQTAMRGGLAWLDTECRERYGSDFVECDESQRTAVLDDIAYPDRAPAGMSHGVRFFTSFRNLTATGFWSSKMGIQDLQYMGNVAISEWQGCPPEQLEKLGLR